MTTSTTDEWVNGMTNIPFAIINTALIAVHSRKVYQDLFTTDRKSIAHKRITPRIDKAYKRMTWLTLITIIAFGLSPIFAAITYNFTIIQTKAICIAVSQIVVIPWQLSKPLMYSVFILRLHQVYGQSAYGYKRSTLLCLAITIITLYVSTALSASVMAMIGGIWIRDADDKFPFYCFIHATKQGQIPLGLQILFDLVFGIGSIIMFQVPINRVFKSMNKSQRNLKNTQKSRQKMLFVGYKYKVLVTCATLTTVVWIITVVLSPEGGIGAITAILAPLDFSVNIICLMLMTPYYPDNIYYQRLCKLCICCCARKGGSYESKATPEAREKQNGSRDSALGTPTPRISSNVKSVDTMDQIEIEAAKTNPDNLLTDVAVKSYDEDNINDAKENKEIAHEQNNSLYVDIDEMSDVLDDI